MKHGTPSRANRGPKNLGRSTVEISPRFIPREQRTSKTSFFDDIFDTETE
jgi:hypothetical protein